MKSTNSTTPKQPIRILLADNQPKVRYALRVLLERQQGVVVVGEAVNIDDLVGQVKSKSPDLILLDWELPGLAPSAPLSSIRNICPEMSVIALSGHADARQRALIAGADAFASKVDPPERLLAVIQECRHTRFHNLQTT